MGNSWQLHTYKELTSWSGKQLAAALLSSLRLKGAHKLRGKQLAAAHFKGAHKLERETVGSCALELAALEGSAQVAAGKLNKLVHC